MSIASEHKVRSESQISSSLHQIRDMLESRLGQFYNANDIERIVSANEKAKIFDFNQMSLIAALDLKRNQTSNLPNSANRISCNSFQLKSIAGS